MSRIGTNPARKKVMQFKPKEITVAIMVYIPNLEGYFKHRLNIFKLCLASLRANTRIPFDLIVLANGCCKEVVDTLRTFQEQGAIDFLLISSVNLGVIGGYKLLFSSALGDIVAYCDDDVVFYPNWLEEQLSLIKSFPRVGMVSGVPVRNGSTHANRTIHAIMENLPKGISIEKTRYIPDVWEYDWCISTGRDPKLHLEETKDLQDIVIERDGVKAIASANHFQFIAKQKVVNEALPIDWSLNLMDSLIPFEENIDNMGYLRLSTMNRLCKHVGNSISQELTEEFAYLDLGIKPTQLIVHKHWLLKIPGLGRFLWALYDRLFKILNNIK